MHPKSIVAQVAGFHFPEARALGSDIPRLDPHVDHLRRQPFLVGSPGVGAAESDGEDRVFRRDDITANDNEVGPRANGRVGVGERKLAMGGGDCIGDEGGAGGGEVDKVVVLGGIANAVLVSLSAGGEDALGGCEAHDGVGVLAGILNAAVGEEAEGGGLARGQVGGHDYGSLAADG